MSESSAMKALVLAVLVGWLLIRAIANRGDEWSARDWLRFAGRLAVGLALSGAGLWMALQVDGGFTRGWSPMQRGGWVAAMLLLSLVGMLRIVATLFHAADDEPLDSPLWNNFLTLLVLSALGIGGAVLGAGALGISQEPALLMAFGVYAVLLAAFPPAWTIPLMEVSGLGSVLGSRGTRWVQAGLGIASFGAGLYLTVRAP